jgi:hypothetical protein
MEELLGHTAIVIKPMFSIAPEPLDPVEMIPTFRPSFLFQDDHMVAPNRQRGVGLPVIGIVEASWLGVLPHQSLNETQLPFRDREGVANPIALEEAQDDDLTAGSPAALPRPMASKGDFIALNFSPEGFRTLFGHTEPMADQPKEPFGRLGRGWTSEPKTVRRNPKDKVLQKLSLGSLRKARGLPDTLKSKSESAAATLEASVLESPSPMMPTAGTNMLHTAQILP